MPAINITSLQKDKYNTVVSHPLQSYEWGEFRKKTGVKIIRRGFEENGKITSGFQLSIHKIPHTPFTIGYLPKSILPTEKMIHELRQIGKDENCIFIQIEPNVIKSEHTKYDILDTYFVPSAHPLFTKYTFVLDITKPENELLENMSSKTRYNIRLAERKGVRVEKNDSDKAFKRYLELTNETTTRQKFYAHTNRYHTLMFETLREQITNHKSHIDTNTLTAHLLTATYQDLLLVTWIVFIFHDTLYYPYGASSSKHRDVMASNLMMWETIKFGKSLGLKKFDMWGALSENPDPKDPWFGFHRFKSGYGPKHVEFVGSYDLIINPAFYQMYKIADKLRWMLLRLKK